MIDKLQNLVLKTIDVNLTAKEKLIKLLSNGITPREAFYLEFTDTEIKEAIKSDNSIQYNMENYTVDENSFVDKEILKTFVITKEELHQLKIKNQLFFKLIEFEIECNLELARILDIVNDDEFNSYINETLNNHMYKIYAKFNLNLRK